MSVITNKQKKDLIVSIFGEGSVSSNGKDIAVYCPICKKSPKIKKKKKLSIVIETGVYHCWVCEAKGKNISRFVETNCTGFKNIEKVRNFFGNKIEKEKDSALQKRNVTLPDDFKLTALSNSLSSRYTRNYLEKRGFDTSDLYRFKAGYSLSSNLKNRVIFPSFDRDLSLNFYVTRACDPSVKFAKYRNCDASKKDIVFNEYLIDWKKPVVIVEGVFDAHKVGENAIPILGSWIDKSYLVFRRIVENNSSVILGLDPDVRGKEIKIAKNLFQHGIEVKLLEERHKDLGDMSKKEVKNLINNAKHYDNMERMRYLISGIKSGSIY